MESLFSEGKPSIAKYLLYTSSLLIVVVLCLTAAQRKARESVPPGPKGYPIVGNAPHMPTVRPWETYSKWAKQLNTDILCLKVLSFPIIILDSAKAAKDLLEKRSSVYSDRPKFPFFDLMGWSWAIQFIGYGEKFRKHRRPFRTYLSQSIIRDFWPIQQKEIRMLLKDLLHNPGEFLEHCHHASAGMTMTILYGVPRGNARTSMIHQTDEAIDSLVIAGNFGDHFVDFLPIMKYIPEWFPGATFQKQAREWRLMCQKMFNAPLDDLKKRIKGGDLTQCLVASLLEAQASGEDPDLDDHMIKSTAGVTYLGGSDTTLSAMQSFFLAMTLYPEVQKRAQAEVDAVCSGSARLPTLEDRPSMPYVESIVKELYRWNPGVPMGLPHSVSQDDIYEGHLIPKGCVIMANLWSIFHDESTYPDPYRFDPRRYLDKAGKVDPTIADPRTLAFGFGRRACPGMYLGDAAVWTTVASVLATFDISQSLDSMGSSIIPSTEYTTGLVSRPLPFKCTITPRSTVAKELISQDLEYNL